MLEPLVDSWEEERSVDIKLQLLTAAVKLFFKRPPEMQVCRPPALAYLYSCPFSFVFKVPRLRPNHSQAFSTTTRTVPPTTASDGCGCSPLFPRDWDISSTLTSQRWNRWRYTLITRANRNFWMMTFYLNVRPIVGKITLLAKENLHNLISCRSLFVFFFFLLPRLKVEVHSLVSSHLENWLVIARPGPLVKIQV